MDRIITRRKYEESLFISRLRELISATTTRWIKDMANDAKSFLSASQEADPGIVFLPSSISAQISRLALKFRE